METVVVPTNNPESSIGEYPKKILDAIHIIQKFAMAENRSGEIPSEYFTIKHLKSFLEVGFKSGLKESFF